MNLRKLFPLISLLLIASAYAQTTQPSSPRATALAMNEAMRAYDEKAMAALQHTTNDDQKRYARASAAADAHVARLLAAAEEKFGKAAVAKVQEAISDISDEDIAAAEEKIDGIKATLTGKADKFTFFYVLVDNQWKTDLPTIFAAAPFPVQLRIDDAYRRGNWAKVAAQDVSAGSYKSLDDLLAAIKKRFDADEEEPEKKD